MPSESPQQRRASQVREDKQRCAEAAQLLRRRIRAGEYERLPHTSAADLLNVAAMLDAANLELDGLPRGMRSAALGLVRSVLDDAARKPGAVPPLSDGPGH